ncbi:hypothetical protein ACNOYE_10625 [Nannocystaceae bacterium ST9]
MATIKLTHAFSGPSLKNIELTRVPVPGELIFINQNETYQVKQVIHVVGLPVDAVVEVSDAHP